MSSRLTRYYLCKIFRRRLNLWTFEKHVKNVEKFLQQLRESGIKLNTAKCNFFKREVIYLGQPISKDGYHQDPQNNDTLAKFRTPPKIIGKLWFLVGFLGYYCAYIKNFFRIMKPLYDILVTPKSKNLLSQMT